MTLNPLNTAHRVQLCRAPHTSDIMTHSLWPQTWELCQGRRPVRGPRWKASPPCTWCGFPQAGIPPSWLPRASSRWYQCDPALEGFPDSPQNVVRGRGTALDPHPSAWPEGEVHWGGPAHGASSGTRAPLAAPRPAGLVRSILRWTQLLCPEPASPEGAQFLRCTLKSGQPLGLFQPKVSG